MKKEMPWFKFKVAEWLTGDIVFEPFNVQGLFINLCALYWQKKGKLTVDDVNNRYKNPPELQVLTDRFISVSGGLIGIKFLEEQSEEQKSTSVQNSENGKKGGRPKGSKTMRKKAVAFSLKATESEQKPIREDKIREDIDVNIHPLRKYIQESCPNVSKLKTQLTEKDCESLLEKYPRTLVHAKLLAMENKKDLTKKYASVYLTLNNWCSMATAEQTPVQRKETLHERELRLSAENHP